MRALSATLLAAQKSASRAPYVKALFDDYRGDRPRLRFTRYYTGAEAGGPSAVVVAGDGSLVRARIDPGTNHLYTSRVASPGPGSTYSSWTDQGAIVAAGTGLALAVWNGNPQLYYVHTDGVGIRSIASGDNGATWGAPATVATGGAAVSYLAAKAATGGPGAPDMALFWNEGAGVFRSRYTGSWGARTAWSNTIASCTGIAVEYQGDWSVIVCGTAPTSTDAKVWSCIYGDGSDQAANTWSALTEITTAVAASGVDYWSPAVEYFSGYRAYFRERYTGSLAYSRVHWTGLEGGANFKQDLWSEPVAFDETGAYGLSAAASGAGLWLVTPAGVWFGPAPAAAYDASGDVLEAEVELQEAGSRNQEAGGRARLVLDNSSGRYSFGGSAIASVSLGMRLALSFGCRTTAGAESSDGPGYWVSAVETRWEAGSGKQGAGRSVVVVEARDAWSLLESWRARRELQWAAGAKTVNQLLGYIFARAGLEFTNGGTSSALTTLTPAFSIDPGETGLTAVKRLLAKVPDRVRMVSAQGNSLYPQASDSSDYTYGTDHVIESARWRDLAAAVNRARVFGLAVFDEAFDFAEAELAGELVKNVNDISITTAAQATARAGFELRAAALESDDSRLVAPLNCGAEVYDVVTVTDALAGLAAVKRRVRALTLRASFAGKPRYEVELVVGSA